jgi:8-oxo-dGTP pyrophosphatase MutT (NUDIX family)
VHRNPSISVAAVVLTNDAGEVALVRKRNTAAWIFPGGKHESGETGLQTAIREVAEELRIVLAPNQVRHLGNYTTPAANEAATKLLSQVYHVQLPPGHHVAPQAEIAQVIWCRPGDVETPPGTRLAPLSSLVLEQLASDSPEFRKGNY